MMQSLSKRKRAPSVMNRIFFKINRMFLRLKSIREYNGRHHEIKVSKFTFKKSHFNDAVRKRPFQKERRRRPSSIMNKFRAYLRIKKRE